MVHSFPVCVCRLVLVGRSEPVKHRDIADVADVNRFKPV